MFHALSHLLTITKTSWIPFDIFYFEESSNILTVLELRYNLNNVTYTHICFHFPTIFN